MHQPKAATQLNRLITSQQHIAVSQLTQMTTPLTAPTADADGSTAMLLPPPPSPPAAAAHSHHMLSGALRTQVAAPPCGAPGLTSPLPTPPSLPLLQRRHSPDWTAHQRSWLLPLGRGVPAPASGWQRLACGRETLLPWRRCGWQPRQLPRGSC